MAFEFFVKDDVFAGHEERCGEEVVLSRLSTLPLLVQSALELLQIFAKHVFAAELSPSSKVVDLGPHLQAVLLVDPVDLLLLTPHDVPVISISFLPLAGD